MIPVAPFRCIQPPKNQINDSTTRSMKHKLLKTICSFLAFSAMTGIHLAPAAAETTQSNVIIIGVDGLSPDGIKNSETPNLDRLMERGAHTFKARAVMPTVSSPNWASMIMGAGPEQHGITSNDWRPDKFEIEPTIKGPGGIFPTIFSLLRQQQPSSVSGCFHDWSGFGRLVEREMIDHLEDTSGPVETTKKAIAFLKEHQPRLLFIHLDHVDGAGHSHGWKSREYYDSVQSADELIGQVLTAIEAHDLFERTVFIITSDHGGRDKGHGGATMDEIEIPWIIAGPGIARGKTISMPVNTYDTAATAAHLLGLEPPIQWIARPVLEAFLPGDL
jgi:predicted AlkP superfamily pyrophosphatase or phosphodiesterase